MAERRGAGHRYNEHDADAARERPPAAAARRAPGGAAAVLYLPTYFGAMFLICDRSQK